MKNLALIIQTKHNLKNIDISWNPQIPEFWAPILEALKTNRSLKSVNISWNELVPYNLNSQHNQLLKAK
jgi:hypothetical protein